jgi:pilus assembly protein CpaE
VSLVEGVLNIGVVGSGDHDIEDLVRAAGMHVSGATLDELAARSGSSATLPDAVVVDVRRSGVPPELAHFRRQHPTIGVVIVTTALDPALLLDAMRAGVNEVVAEPLTVEGISIAIGRVAGQRPVEKGQTFAFVGAKGGVGTTTVAVNVAAALAAAVAKDAHVLLVDLQQGGGDATVFVGAEPKFTVHDALENTKRLDQLLLRRLVAPVSKNFDLLAASETATDQPDSAKLRPVLDIAAQSYKYVILDVPGSNGAVLDSLDHVSKIILVANQELATVRSASRMAAALHRRYGRDKVELVISRSDRQADIGHDDVERVVGVPIAFTFPSDYRSALQALNQGRPLAFDNHNELSAAFKRFAAKLAGVTPQQAATTRTGLFGRLTLRD